VLRTKAEGDNPVCHVCASDTLIDVLLARQAAALEDRTLLPISWEEVERQLAAELNTHDKARPGQPAPDEDEFQQLTAKTWHYWIEHITYQRMLNTVKASVNEITSPWFTPVTTSIVMNMWKP